MFYYTEPEDSNQVFACMVICAVTISLFTFQEIIEFQQQKWYDYFFDFFNLVNAIYYISFYVYFWLRITKFENKTMLPLDRFGPGKDISKLNLEDEFWIQFLSLIQLAGLAMKFMETIRFSRGFGRIVQLLGYMVRDEIPFFLIFFLFWVALFSLSFQILGNDISRKSYVDKDMDIQYSYFLHSWSQAIKSGLVPETQSWRDLRNASPENKLHKNYSIAMIGLNWLL